MASIPYCFNGIRAIDQKIRTERRYSQSNSTGDSSPLSSSVPADNNNSSTAGISLFGHFISFGRKLSIPTVCNELLPSISTTASSEQQ
ncbi:unnamed protein product [Didymodactylos carnosus]|uniref:Uncharacterized protein n=1 Tax=Didymodactylos carnosus TaxID=1234261 RepID=A0A816C3I1_9BILA|nr:unnamed protein product [Didymodactylos carnosus]CAF4505188.1 unnamed protein product [Didymodactylos carnosus]